MLFLVVAKDGTDDDAPARRAAARPGHLEAARALFEGGRLVTGGALLADDGRMIGSMMLLEADDEKAARALIDADVYVKGGVWQSYELWPYKRAF